MGLMRHGKYIYVIDYRNIYETYFDLVNECTNKY